MAPYRRRMVNAARVRDDIVRLVHRGLPVPEFAQAVGNALPAAQQLRLVEIEVREPDYNKWTQLARSDQPAASLSDVTAGDLDRSLRQREIRRPGGFADELRAVLGHWGALTVFRETRRPHFTAAEVQFVSSVAGLVADGLRRGLLLDAARGGAEDVGLLMLADDDEVALANPAAQRWLDDLGTGDRAGARLPLVVPAVARQARALEALARARARTRSGVWLIVRASLMGDGTV